MVDTIIQNIINIFEWFFFSILFYSISFLIKFFVNYTFINEEQNFLSNTFFFKLHFFPNDSTDYVESFGDLIISQGW